MSSELPHVTTGPHGETVMEWWRDERTLTVYIDGGKATYLCAWGPDMNSQMQEGDACEMNALLEWLAGGPLPDLPPMTNDEAIAAALKSARSDGYLAGKRMMAMSLRHHVSGYGAGLVEDVIGDYGGPRWPPPDGARK